MPTEIKAYQCHFCRKYGKGKSRIKRHEEDCVHNPESKACPTCRNSFPIYSEVGISYVEQGCKAGITDFESGRRSDKVKRGCEKWKREA